MAESWYDGVAVSAYSKTLMPLANRAAWQAELAVTGGAPLNILGDTLSLRGVTWTGARPAIVHLVDNWYPGDGGGTFRWDPTSTATDNGATVIKETATSVGRWIRQITGDVDARWWGVSTSSSDNTVALQAAVNSGFSSIKLPDGSIVTGAFTMDTADTMLFGTSKAILVRKVGVTTNLITINNSAARCKLFGFTIDGQRALQTYSYNTGEVLNFAPSVSIGGLRVLNSISNGIRGQNGAVGMAICQCVIQVCGDFGIFINGTGAGADPARCLVENCTVEDFGIAGGGGGVIPSVGIGVRSIDGGTRIINNVVSNVGVECWTNSNRAIVTGNVIDMATGTAGDFGLSVTGYRSVVSNNIISGTTSYGIEIIDAACTATGNVVSKPLGAGIAININPGHGNPGDTITITGNTVEDADSTNAIFAAIIIDGISGPLPRAITITGNTCTGAGRLLRVGTMVSNFTASGNTFFRTSGTLSLVVLNGSKGNFSGNSLGRADISGAVGQAISVGGSQVLVGSNDFSFQGTTNAVGVTNAILIISGAGVALQTTNVAVNVLNTFNNGLISQNAIPILPNLTVSQLSTASVLPGAVAFATNGRKPAEGPGAGTGVLAYKDPSAWRAADTSATVAE